MKEKKMSSGRFLQAWENARSGIAPDAQYAWLETTKALAIALDRAYDTNVRNNKDCNDIEKTINFLISNFTPPAKAYDVEKWKTMLRQTPEHKECDVQGIKTRIKGLKIVNELLVYIRDITGDDESRRQGFSIIDQLQNPNTSLEKVEELVKSGNLLTKLKAEVLLPSGTGR